MEGEAPANSSKVLQSVCKGMQAFFPSTCTITHTHEAAFRGLARIVAVMWVLQRCGNVYRQAQGRSLTTSSHDEATFVRIRGIEVSIDNLTQSGDAIRGTIVHFSSCM